MRSRADEPTPSALGGSPSSHSENFSFADFFGRQGVCFDDRFTSFAEYAERLERDAVVMREIVGPAGPRVRVRDAAGSTTDLLMLGSNNYLGLANDPSVVEGAMDALRTYGVGCGGPPLLNGMTALHRELERRLAAFKCCEDAMIFSSGYAANVGWVTGLLDVGDVLIYDEQSHASVFDGIRMGRIRSIAVPHNDLGAFRTALATTRKARPHANVVVCSEGVFSMDGEIAPLRELRVLCDEYEALLALDDAHGTGVLGDGGRGTSEHFGLEGRVDLTMASFSKVFAATGGFVAGSRRMIQYLRYFARSYMFSASLPPPVVAGVLAAIDFIERHPERVQQLRSNVRDLVHGLRAEGFSADSSTGIVPLRVPGSIPLQSVVGRLHDEGLFVNGVEYPAVPKDEQRLRLSVMATFTKDDLAFAIDRLATVGAELGFIEANHAA